MMTFSEFEGCEHPGSGSLYGSFTGRQRQVFVEFIYNYMCVEVSPKNILPRDTGEERPDFDNVALKTEDEWRTLFVQAFGTFLNRR